MPDIFALDKKMRVRLSEDLIRVAKLPRRVWTDDEAQKLADELTVLLKTPYGQMRLRPKQAVALLEIGTVGGIVGPLPCGCGKTLISLLAPVVAFADRPLLIVPAKLIDKTRRDARELARHWVIPEYYPIWSYEWLGRAQAADALDKQLPDLIFFDEAHKIRNSRAAVTRRVRRFFSEHAGVKCIVASGTLVKRSMHDYAPATRWVFSRDPDRMPLPQKWSELESWADALDERKGQVRRADPDALQILCNDEENEIWKTDPRAAARSAYRRRFIETEGVVAAFESGVDATLTISEIAADPLGTISIPQIVELAFNKLRREAKTPDDWQLMDRLEAWAVARQLALGFYYRWSPRPPEDWLRARKAWAKFVWEILKKSRELDSELQVRRFVDAAASEEDPDERMAEGISILAEWREIQPTFVPNSVPVWIDDFALRLAADWAKRERGIVWTEHVCLGERLEHDFGLHYYGRKGQRREGNVVHLIDAHPPGHPLVASIQSNAEGRNLQAWNQNLIVSPPANGKNFEQLLARTHREGQLADEVEVEVFNFCAEHIGAFWQSVKDAEYVQASTGAPQKLLLAGKVFSTADDIAAHLGHVSARWNK